jgi:hypothetical protein
MMRSWIDVRFIACAVCIAGATACSDDDSPATGVNSLQPDSGTAGSSAAGSGGSGGAGGSVSSGAGTGGRPVGGGGGGASSAADAGTEDGGAPPAADGGVEPSEPDAGALDAGGGVEEPPPAADIVTFAELFPVLQASCGGCHGGNGGPPPFAQANQAAGYAITQGTSDDGDLFYEEMVELAVVQRTMPPACGGQALGTGACLSVAGADLLQAWVDDGAQP